MLEFFGLALALIGLIGYANTKNRDWVFSIVLGSIIALHTYLY